jgi:Cd2+/Zn2+-exporting ATPase
MSGTAHPAEHADACGCGHTHPDFRSRPLLRVLFAGSACVVNALLLDWLRPGAGGVADLSALAGALLLAWPILRAAWHDLRHGNLHMDALVALAVVAALAAGDFRTAGVVAFFMLLSLAIESRSAEGAHRAVESLIRLTPRTARRLTDEPGGLAEVAVADLRVGDRLRVFPGEQVPADGVIRGGRSSLNESTITGESLPRDKGADDEVFAGTLNLTGALEIEVARVGGDTTLEKVKALILAAQRTRLPALRLMDRYAAHYTPFVLMLAAFCWYFTDDWSRVTALLVVSCPCALILAGPTAMVAALSAAARMGLLVKHVAALETFSRVRAMVFDKTGTLTTGDLAVSRLYPAEGVTNAELLLTAAAAEKFSKHPAALALGRLAREVGLNPPDPEEFHEAAGRGVSARVDGAEVRVGRAAWLREQGHGLPEAPDAEGVTQVWVVRGDRCLGWIALADGVRPEAAAALRELRAERVEHIALVTGDRKPVAERVAAELSCDLVRAECLPGAKVDFVHLLKARGLPVAVIGDGVNDAPALAAGDTGIAMGAAGIDAAIHSADMALMNNDLRRLPRLLRLSRAARAAILQNIGVGMVFILAGWTFSFRGEISPIAAALLHNAGSLVVLFNSARLVRAGEEMEEELRGPDPMPPQAG